MPNGPFFRYRNLTKQQRTISKDAVAFVLNKFCPRMQKYMTVRVHGKENMLSNNNEYANCEFVSDDPYNREFRILIENTLSTPVYIRTLIHELVHVKQYAKGEMRHLERTHKYIKWQGRKIDVETTSYWDQPWEIEAHGREEGLTQQFMDQFPQWESFCTMTVI